MIRPVVFAALLLAAAGCQAGHGPKVAAASGEAEAAVKAFRVVDGFDVQLVAAEPLVANPVAFWIDGPGRFLVAETFRQDKWGVPDNRDHPEWLDDDLRSVTNEDRRRMYLRHHPEYARDYTREEDRVRLVLDEDGDGTCETARVFAGGFRDILDGTGAGLLRRGKDVYYTCIPHLWRLRDQDGDGDAEERKALATGFGVRIALRGHDLHGLAMGPDGRLYFSIGDRGYHLTTPDGRRLADPRSGAVFRCEPDGTGLEVYATGLRNPQELAFDDSGNLFTVDNNSDSDDKARIVQVVEGGETGWRMNFQYLPRRGPWVEEGWWRPRFEGQAAFFIPPIDNIGSGPSGFACNPGTGLPSRYDGWFFVCDFLGSRASSGVRAFALDPDGAGFKLRETHHLIQGLLPTDCDFGPDGSFYVLDWVEGWVGVGKGRIYRLRHREAGRGPAVDATAALLAKDLDAAPEAELFPLLGHADRRVRLAAQFALAARGPAVYPRLRDIADRGKPISARLHALWALAQAGRRDPDALLGLASKLYDPEPEIRAQGAKIAGESQNVVVADRVQELLADPSPRVRYFAALALAKIGEVYAWPAILRFIGDNPGDPLLRHAGVMALAGLADPERLGLLTAHPSADVRMAAVLALRRLRAAGLARFLEDSDPLVATEAARAIYDVPVAAALPALAATLAGTAKARPWPYLVRALDARDLLGTAADAEALAAFAADAAAPAAGRAEALRILAAWDPAPERDRLLNDVRPRPARSRIDAQAAVRPRLEALLRSEADVAAEAARVAGALDLREAAPVVESVARDPAAGAAARVAALEALRTLAPEGGFPLAAALMEDGDSRVRAGAASALADGDPAAALPLLRRAIDEGGLRERQAALRALGRMNDPESEEVLAGWLEAVAGDGAPAEVRLDVESAGRRRAAAGSDRIRSGVEALDGRRDPADALARWLACQEGGDAAAGRRVFVEKVETACLRCHSVPGHDDPTIARAGPDLATVGARRDRRYLVESIVEPGRQIAEGYQMVTLETEEDGILSGRVVAEDPDILTIETMDTGRPERVAVKKKSITDRRSEASAMPTDLIQKLSPEEVRDLVDYLAGLGR